MGNEWVCRHVPAASSFPGEGRRRWHPRADHVHALPHTDATHALSPVLPAADLDVVYSREVGVGIRLGEAPGCPPYPWLPALHTASKRSTCAPACTWLSLRQLRCALTRCACRPAGAAAQQDRHRLPSNLQQPRQSGDSAGEDGRSFMVMCLRLVAAPHCHAGWAAAHSLPLHWSRPHRVTCDWSTCLVCRLR